jgi:PAS domain S-box-containing protein
MGSQGSIGSGDKRQQKRAANRRSAQLSRKRKKQYIEELQEENDELRRKEQILRSIPDLIVVFDSSGKLGFVSQSVSRFIDMTPEELEGTSFWDRLCEDSVRLLKAAFMDSLAARKADSATAPLGSGVWELRLADKDSNYHIVTLNGVVHFTGEAPECVCCIRPRDQQPVRKLSKERLKAVKSSSRTVSISDGSRSISPEHPEIRVKPNQSVISNKTSDPVKTTSGCRKKARREEDTAIAKGREVVRISDGDSGESGSDDGITSS